MGIKVSEIQLGVTPDYATRAASTELARVQRVVLRGANTQVRDISSGTGKRRVVRTSLGDLVVVIG